MMAMALLLLLAQAVQLPPPPPGVATTADPVAADAPRARAPDAGWRSERPSLAELRAAATALTLAEPARARSLVDRSRWAGLLPELQLGVSRRVGATAALDVASTASVLSPIELGTAEDLRYEGRATWDLSKLVFNGDELNAQAQALRMADVRREVELLVIRLFFERRRLRDELERTADRARALRLCEVEAELDALTGGMLSRTDGERHGGTAR